MYKLIEFIRRIYVVLLFIVIEAIALNYYAHSSYYTQAKILSYANRVTGSVQSTFFGIKHFFTLRRENDMLTARVAELEGRLSAYREMAAAAQTDSLAAAIAADTLGVGLEGMSQYRYMTARTVANSINRDRNFITLNRGLSHGVMTDMAVITPDGAMVGYVVGCSERYSVVLPLLNTDFRTSGKIVGDDYCHGMRCSNHIALNVKNFPDMHRLLDRARHLALDALTNESRGLNDAELKALGEVKKDADLLAAAHDEVVARLEKDVERLQTAIDRHLILQGQPRRFAVRLDARGNLEALLVLEH